MVSYSQLKPIFGIFLHGSSLSSRFQQSLKFLLRSNPICLWGSKSNNCSLTIRINCYRISEGLLWMYLFPCK
jgi:hypothetical protein